MRRVVVTGMAGVTALGNTADDIFTAIQQGKTATRNIAQWHNIKGLNTQLGAPIENFNIPEHYTRKQTRGMGRVAKFATVATENALKDANLLDQEDLLNSGNVGVAYGSCSGSTKPLAELTSILIDNSVNNVNATTYIKGMSHTCAVNIALFFGLTGRLIPTSSACTSSSQAIGYAYEAIKYGLQDIMIAGGAEELCPSQVAVFDTLYATSQMNEHPELTPRPFDRDRDGLVLGEGGVTLILESLEHAKQRGANIYAELVGFGTNCDAVHVTQPTAEKMQKALELALKNANLNADDIGYINAHGTATERGDIAESQATANIFGPNTPISSLKGYFGHTLGACGALESWLSIEMMRKGMLLSNANLQNIDPKCSPLNYLQSSVNLNVDYIMSNNFAFGGVNTSLIFKKWK
ncbi:beta-ketoacyl-ACP synthase [Pseudofrancisella aestuarii]|uniref:Beta-ketoacyl-ACP synthase n=1 Tax=Pseudofrancisella aestuarii TaxID=2670347 RepID=A0ABV9TA77_9GAMM